MATGEEDLPRQLGPYRLLEKLGQGGAGTVYLARSTREDAIVPGALAVKVLRNSVREEQTIARRFKHEAAIAVTVDSPHVVKVFDVGAAGGTLYIAMEHVLGFQLLKVLAAYSKGESYPPLDTLLSLVCDALRGLHALHTAVNPETHEPLGVVHRDISPKNLLVDHNGRIVLIDLGLGRSNIQEWQTKMGVVLGTPGYLSPEQASLNRIDHRSDIYALGIVFWEMLALRRHFPRDELARVLEFARSPEFLPPSQFRPDVPPVLDEIARKALALKPEERFQSAMEFLHAIDATGLMSHAPPAVFPAAMHAELETRARSIEVLVREEGRAEEVTEAGRAVSIAMRTQLVRARSNEGETVLAPIMPVVLDAPTRRNKVSPYLPGEAGQVTVLAGPPLSPAAAAAAAAAFDARPPIAPPPDSLTPVVTPRAPIAQPRVMPVAMTEDPEGSISDARIPDSMFDSLSDSVPDSMTPVLTPAMSPSALTTSPGTPSPSRVPIEVRERAPISTPVFMIGVTGLVAFTIAVVVYVAPREPVTARVAPVVPVVQQKEAPPRAQPLPGAASAKRTAEPQIEPAEDLEGVAVKPAGTAEAADPSAPETAPAPAKVRKTRMQATKTAPIVEDVKPSAPPSVEQRFATLIRDAKQLQSSHPDRATELNEIIADASMWKLSEQEDRVAVALKDLEQRLARVRASLLR